MLESGALASNRARPVRSAVNGVEMVLEHTTPADGNGAAVQLNATAPAPYVPSSLRNPFPPIADYAFLSDCENTCLKSSSGSVEWLCVPRPDSPSVFGAILDRGAGHFRISPYGVSVPAARRYLSCATPW